jgi:hypothetical protein
MKIRKLFVQGGTAVIVDLLPSLSDFVSGELFSQCSRYENL